MMFRVSLRYFVSYCSLFLVYIFKVFRKTSSSFLLRNNMLNILLALFISKALPSQVLKDVSLENLETTPKTFPFKLPAEIYLSQVFNCGSIYTIYPQWEKCLVLFPFCTYFFLFLLLVSLTNTNIKKLGNIKKVSKLPKMTAWCPISLPKWNFCKYWQRSLGKQILNFSHCVLYVMKNRVSSRYCVIYCKFVVI